MSKKRRHDEKMRAKACAMAVDVVCSEEPHESGTQKAGELHAMCVFFEAFITRGSAWTEKTMGLMRHARAEKAKKKAKVIHLVKK